MPKEKIAYEPWSHDWTQRVLSYMKDDEKVNGKPKHHGLRRMVELIRGPIVYSRTVLIETPNKDNGWAAISEYNCRIKTEDGEVEYGDIADATFDNVGSSDADKKKFAPFVVAVSSTRSKSRAWRDALSLAIVTYDELPKDVDSVDAADFEPMNDAQIDTCKTICKRLKLKFEDFVFEETGLKDLNKISRLEGARLVKELNRQQQAEK